MTLTKPARITSIDLARGVVMVLMALDHAQLRLPLCRWFDGVKRRHRGRWWVSYV